MRHNTCLSCNRKFYSLEAVRGHMKDTAHCKVNFRGDDGAQELAAFYKITATTSADGTSTTLASPNPRSNRSSARGHWWIAKEDEAIYP